ncbi:MAG: hypothetical protein EA376_06200 [Phycisphaeraceae bacterium]|nr:MAG: hypothetical protein EA376_06200 [Phycisphaeraceae bacterium]
MMPKLRLAIVYLAIAACLPATRTAVRADAAPGARAEQVRYDGHALGRILIRDRDDLEFVLQHTTDHWGERLGLGPQDFRLPPGAVEKLEAAGLTLKILHPDIQILIDAERDQLARAGAGFYDAYRTLNEINARLDHLAALDPDRVSLFSIGNSVQGRPIRGVRIEGPIPGAGGGGGSAITRPALLIAGCQHAREWVSAMAPLYVAEQIVAGDGLDERITTLLDNVEIIVIPVVNPDGYLYSWTTDRLWRKNRKLISFPHFGVDLNRNWSVAWGGEGSSGLISSELYRGAIPFSEPCSRHVRDFILDNPHIRAAYDVHNYSQLVLGAWGHTVSEPADRDVTFPLAEQIAEAMTDVDDAEHSAGHGGFQLGLASGIMTDWVSHVAKAHAWTLELRDTGETGFLLPPEQIIPAGEETLAATLVLGERLMTPLEFLVIEGPPDFTPADEPAMVRMKPVRMGALPGAAPPVLHTRIGAAGEFSSAPMTPLGDGVYEGELPAAPCGAVIHYYFEMTTAEGATAIGPGEGAETPHETTAREVHTVFMDDFSTDTGWSPAAPDDDATAGLWERINPLGTDAQPSDCHSPPFCYITGQAVQGQPASASSVRGGKTTLTSPRLDATAAPGEAWISYRRWYSNNMGGATFTQSMLIEISNDDGETWTLLEAARDNRQEWLLRRWRIADFVEPTDALRIRFIARDHSEMDMAVVEAGVDDVRLEFAACPGGPIGDLNGDGVVNAQDLAILLGSWGPCPDPEEPCPADVNGDGVVNAQDLGIVLGSWGAP